MTWILKVLACVSLQGEASQAWHVPGPLHCCGASPAEPEAEWQKAGAVLFRQGQVRFIQCIVYGSFLRSYVFPPPKSSHQIRPWYIINSTTVVNFGGLTTGHIFIGLWGHFQELLSLFFCFLAREAMWRCAPDILGICDQNTLFYIYKWFVIPLFDRGSYFTTIKCGFEYFFFIF